MMHKNHVKTNSSLGVAASSFYTVLSNITMIEAIIVYVATVTGTIMGQLVGPDLDIKKSTPARKGGGEFIALLALLVSLYESMETVTIVLALLTFFLFLGKYSSQAKVDLSILTSVILIFNMINLLYFLELKITAGLTLSLFAFILNLARKHRGVTHSLDMAVLILITGYLFATEVNLEYGYLNLVYVSLIIGYALGYTMHIAMDILGGRGVLLIAILNYRVKGLNIYHTNTAEEELVANITTGSLIVASVIIIYFSYAL